MSFCILCTSKTRFKKCSCCCTETRPAPAECVYRVLKLKISDVAGTSVGCDIYRVCRVHINKFKRRECFCVYHSEWSEEKTSSYLRKCPKWLAEEFDVVGFERRPEKYFPGEYVCSGCYYKGREMFGQKGK